MTLDLPFYTNKNFVPNKRSRLKFLRNFFYKILTFSDVKFLQNNVLTFQ
jgi:hypothetical protein